MKDSAADSADGMNRRLIRLLLSGYLSGEKFVLPPETDALALLKSAEKMRIAPVIARLLMEQPTLEPFKPQFEARIRMAKVRAIQTAELQKRVISMLADADIQIISFKGIILSDQVYGDFGLREAADVDLFVRCDQVKRAAEILSTARFSSSSLAEQAMDFLLKHTFSLDLYSPKLRLLIDLHWDVTDGYVRPLWTLQELMRQTEKRQVDECTMTAFNAETTFVLTVLHGAKNSWWNIGSALECAALMVHYPHLDYDRIMMRLRKQGLSTMLLVGAHLSRLLFEIELPIAIVAQMTFRAQSLAERIVNEMDVSPVPVGWAKVMLNLKMREGLRERLYYLIFKMRGKKVDLADTPLKTLVRHLRRIV